MRIISGLYKSRRFDVPTSFKARPTTDFAKENLFNVLIAYFDFEEEGFTALDLFSGTGSISIELVSRGAERVISVEKDRAHHSFIRSVIAKIKTDRCLPICADVFKYVQHCHEQFDFIFADPPYALTNLAELPEIILKSKMLKPEGIFVLEHGKELSFTTHPLFLEHRNYGSVNFSFFKAADSANELPTP